mmetsp:Transcript_6116/g.23135  ORF Transcript_6116/g.23135 Transcript_6116/m.23135 type:complete len:347 (-) Transcript_6116:612-1652(-)
MSDRPGNAGRPCSSELQLSVKLTRPSGTMPRLKESPSELEPKGASDKYMACPSCMKISAGGAHCDATSRVKADGLVWQATPSPSAGPEHIEAQRSSPHVCSMIPAASAPSTARSRRRAMAKASSSSPPPGPASTSSSSKDEKFSPTGEMLVATSFLSGAFPRAASNTEARPPSGILSSSASESRGSGSGSAVGRLTTSRRRTGGGGPTEAPGGGQGTTAASGLCVLPPRAACLVAVDWSPPPPRAAARSREAERLPRIPVRLVGLPAAFFLSTTDFSGSSHSLCVNPRKSISISFACFSSINCPFSSINCLIKMSLRLPSILAVSIWYRMSATRSMHCAFALSNSR